MKKIKLWFKKIFCKHNFRLIDVYETNILVCETKDILPFKKIAYKCTKCNKIIYHSYVKIINQWFPE
jgi:hypothetical protein